MKPNTNSLVLWSNAKLQLIITGLNASSNRKTGNMVQSYILRRDVSPMTALATNSDKSICGSCPLKGATVNGKRTGRTCYVNVGQGAQQTWNNQSNFAGNTDAITGRVLRLGSYGDPAFVPITVWRKLIVKVTRSHWIHSSMAQGDRATIPRHRHGIGRVTRNQSRRQLPWMAHIPGHAKKRNLATMTRSFVQHRRKLASAPHAKTASSAVATPSKPRTWPSTLTPRTK
jgi:hypothetical protein